MRIFIFLSIIGLFISCDSDKLEDPIYPTTLQGIWNSIALKSALKADKTDVSAEINSRLNSYTPKLTLSFTATGCSFYFPGESFENQRRYSYTIKDEQIIFNVDDIPELNDNKIRAKIRIKKNKLYMSFELADFKNFIWVLGDNYPFHKDFINPATSGSVTLIVDKIESY